MDNAYKFERLINKYIGTPDYITYANNWDDKNERTSLLFTACIKEYDKNSTGEIGEKIEYFMENLFKEDSEDKKTSLECVNFLNELQ